MSFAFGALVEGAEDDDDDVVVIGFDSGAAAVFDDTFVDETSPAAAGEDCELADGWSSEVNC